MKLSAEQFAELAASFDAGQSAGKPERRRAARLDLQARIRIRPVIDNQRLDPLHVIVSNFSARGLSFAHPTAMESGTQFITELPRKGGGCVELLCTVVHTELVGPDAYRIGAEFTCIAPAMSSGPGNANEMSRIREKVFG